MGVAGRHQDGIGVFAEIRDLEQRTVTDHDMNYRVPMDVSKMVLIPERFRNSL